METSAWMGFCTWDVPGVNNGDNAGEPLAKGTGFGSLDFSATAVSVILWRSRVTCSAITSASGCPILVVGGAVVCLGGCAKRVRPVLVEVPLVAAELAKLV